MKKHVFTFAFFLSLVSCQSKSDCYGGRLIFDTVEKVVKYEKRQESYFKEKEGKKYIACNFPDTLIKNQNYRAIIKLLQTKPNEKWVGQPCEIEKLEILDEQQFETPGIGQKTLFTGGNEKTEKGESLTIGIYITKKTDKTIEYEFTELIDWKYRRVLKGQAILQSTKNDKLETRNKEIESAFRFVDSEKSIEILITKDFKINQTKARLIEKDKSTISGLMFNK